MSTTCSTLIARAQAFNPLNASLTSDRSEMLARIQRDQQQLFTSVAALTRDYSQTAITLTSTSGSSERYVDITSTTLIAAGYRPVERIVKLALTSTGEEVRQVDVVDTDAELAPRYYVQGLRLHEVSNDWSTTTGTVSLTLTYVVGPAAIDTTGDLSQVISLTDEWADLLVLPLAMYLVQKDPGRDPAEYQRLSDQLDDLQKTYVAYLSQYGGTQSSRFLTPTPQQNTKD